MEFEVLQEPPETKTTTQIWLQQFTGGTDDVRIMIQLSGRRETCRVFACITKRGIRLTNIGSSLINGMGYGIALDSDHRNAKVIE